MSERNAVQAAFDIFGRDAGLEKKSGSWYGRSEEVVAASNLQKSQYGSSFYINQGFCLVPLDCGRYPKINQTHIQARLEDLLPDREGRISELLDLEFELPDADRIEELVALLTGELLPLIEKGSSVDGLRALMQQGVFAGAGITGPAQTFLRQADPS